METKVCTKCKAEKSVGLFTPRPAKKRLAYHPHCRECRAKVTANYRDKNPEKIAAYKEAYRNSEHGKAVQKAYDANRYWSDPKSENERNRLYRKERPDHEIARKREYRKRNPDYSRTCNHNRRTRKFMAEGMHTSTDIQNLLIDQKGRCKVCYVDVSKGYHVDHIVALVNGGSNWPSNLQILCPTCNTSKGAKDFDEWLNCQEDLNSTGKTNEPIRS